MVGRQSQLATTRSGWETGEHFYDPDVGGDTETITLFEAIAGADRASGDIGRWLEYAEARTRDGYLNIEHDGSAYDAIDWETDGE